MGPPFDPRTVKTGSFARHGEPARSSLTAVAWNIERGLSIDPWLRVPSLREADILLLSEVDDGMARTGNIEVAAALAEGLGMHYAYAAEYLELTRGAPAERRRTRGQTNRTGLHGNAILSRWPLHDVRRVSLPERFDWSRNYERRLGERNALVATIDLGSGPLTLVSTHLEAYTTPAARAEQMRALLAALPPRGAAIIGGDFNTIGVPLGNWWGVKLGPREALTLAARCARSTARLADPAPYEPLFAEAESAGFQFRETNAGQGTFGTHPLVPRFLRPKLDWLLVRELTVEARATYSAPAAAAGPFWQHNPLTDHDGVGIRVRLGPRDPK
jgi:endonuclease/exonuclease/phosphatase family metal-dependent hydrolase